MARYALETIPDPSVDDALRDALGKLKGRPLLGVIGSLGVRRDAKAVDAMAKLLADADADVAQAAARALGKIGTPEAAKALEAALAGASAANQVDFCEGLFRCAEALSAEGQAAQSQAIYDRLRGLSPAPQQVRAGALRGAILARQKEGIPLLLEAIRGADYVLTAAAARIGHGDARPGGHRRAGRRTAQAAGRQADPDHQHPGLPRRRVGRAGPAGPGLQGRPGACVWPAIHNLTHLGYAPALPLLAELSLTGEGDLAAAARTCLGNFPGKDADATIVAMLTHQDAKVRASGRRDDRAAERRRVGRQPAQGRRRRRRDRPPGRPQGPARPGRCGRAARAAEDPGPRPGRPRSRRRPRTRSAPSASARASRPAATSSSSRPSTATCPTGPSADVTKKVADLVKAGALAVEASNGNFGDPANGTAKKLRVDYTVNGVAASKTVREQETLTFTAVSTPPAIVDAICGAMGGAQGEAKLALLRTLRSAGGPKALQTVQAAAADNDAQVKDTALRVLCDWPTPDALPLVAELLKSPPSKTIKVLALRGFVRLVPQQDAPDAKKLESLKDAMALAERNEEKRLVLSALGNVPTADALALVASHLEDPVLKEEACLAAVAIAEKIAASHGAEVTAAMKQVAKLTANKKLAARANALARQAKK